jgi:hypothetical protein
MGKIFLDFTINNWAQANLQLAILKNVAFQRWAIERVLSREVLAQRFDGLVTLKFKIGTE